MTARSRTILIGCLLAGVLAASAAGYALLSKDLVREDTTGAQQANDTAAPILLAEKDAGVLTPTGNSTTLSAIAEGRPLVINFWATWCPYCVREMPDLSAIAQEYANKVSFAFVDVCDGKRERMEDAQAWLAENDFEQLPVYYDTELTASTSFGAYALPLTVVVSAEGEVVSSYTGTIDPDLLRGTLNTLVQP